MSQIAQTPKASVGGAPLTNKPSATHRAMFNSPIPLPRCTLRPGKSCTDDEFAEICNSLFNANALAGQIAYLMSKVGGLNGPDAEDVIMGIVVLRLRKWLPKFDPSRGPFEKWYYTILYWAARDARNAVRRGRQIIPLDELLETGFEPEAEELKEDETAQVPAILEIAQRLLPEKTISMLKMRHIDGLSVKDIAKHYGISPNTITVTIIRALARLAEYFKNNGGSSEFDS